MLLLLCLQFVPPNPRVPSPPPRTLEDLKARYYSVARTLLVTREGGEAPVSTHTCACMHTHLRRGSTETLMGVMVLTALTHASHTHTLHV